MRSDEVFSDNMIYFLKAWNVFHFFHEVLMRQRLKTVRENKHFTCKTFLIKEVAELSVLQVFK